MLEGGRFASDPAQATIEKLGPGRVGCEDAPSAKAKLQLSSGRSISHYSKNMLFESFPYLLEPSQLLISQSS